MEETEEEEVEGKNGHKRDDAHRTHIKTHRKDEHTRYLDDFVVLRCAPLLLEVSPFYDHHPLEPF